MEHENTISKYIVALLSEYQDVELAEAEFKRIIAEDTDTRNSYKDWCNECGYSFRNGFTDFAEEYLQQRDSVWDVLTDFDDNE